MAESELLRVPQRLALDGTLDATVTGAKPGETVTVTATLTTSDAIRWSSMADFRADDRGTVSLADSRPLSGSYDVADANGLLWSLEPDDRSKAEVSVVVSELDPLSVEVAAASDGRELGRSEVVIEKLAPGVKRVPLTDHGLGGELFVPASEGPFRPVVVLSGSGGGAPLRSAAFLASHGYLALALAYFSWPGLPAELVDIEIEYFERGISWLTSRGDAEGPVAVIGTSRGGELSLLLGLHLGIETVIAYVPSPIVHSGITTGVEGWLSDVPAWRLGGRPVPYLSHTDGKLYWRDGAVVCTPTYLDCLSDWDRVAAATMALEECRSNVLMLSGAQDDVWPSSLYCELAMARLRRRRDGRQRHVMLPGAGHTFPPPVLPATVTNSRHPLADDRIALGGSPRANAQAGALAQQEVLQALAGDLGDREWS